MTRKKLADPTKPAVVPIPKHEKVKSDFPAIMAECRGIVTMACSIAGINRDTYYQWRNSDPEFAKACDASHEMAGDFVESKLYELIEEKNPGAVMFYCKTKLRNRGYIEKTESTNTIQILSHEDRLKELSDESK